MTKYHYYQGFHDFCVYPFLLYNEDIHIGSLLVQRILEFQLKDYFLSKGGDMVANITDILDDIIKHIDRDAYNFFQEKCPVVSTLAVSWILCLFMHEIKEINKGYRILDYILCAHPLAAYYMSAQVSISELFYW